MIGRIIFIVAFLVVSPTVQAQSVFDSFILARHNTDRLQAHEDRTNSYRRPSNITNAIWELNVFREKSPGRFADLISRDGTAVVQRAYPARKPGAYFQFKLDSKSQSRAYRLSPNVKDGTYKLPVRTRRGTEYVLVHVHWRDPVPLSLGRVKPSMGLDYPTLKKDEVVSVNWKQFGKRYQESKQALF